MTAVAILLDEAILANPQKPVVSILQGELVRMRAEALREEGLSPRDLMYVLSVLLEAALCSDEGDAEVVGQVHNDITIKTT